MSKVFYVLLTIADCFQGKKVENREITVDDVNAPKLQMNRDANEMNAGCIMASYEKII